MKKQYASITKKLSFTIDQLSNVDYEIKNGPSTREGPSSFPYDINFPY